jgi:hypothetical protein
MNMYMDMSLVPKDGNMSMSMDPADGSQSSIANGNITMPPLIDGSDDINPVDGNTTSSPENCTERLGTSSDILNDAIDGNGGCIDDETRGGEEHHYRLLLLLALALALAMREEHLLPLVVVARLPVPIQEINVLRGVYLHFQMDVFVWMIGRNSTIAKVHGVLITRLLTKKVLF